MIDSAPTEPKPPQHDEPAIIELTGLKCPLPVLKLARYARQLARPAIAQVITDDPKAPEDIQHFCRENAHVLINQVEDKESTSPTRTLSDIHFFADQTLAGTKIE